VHVLNELLVRDGNLVAVVIFNANTTFLDVGYFATYQDVKLPIGNGLDPDVVPLQWTNDTSVVST
jgi:hypothetical protein